ncbi:MAG: SDR family NAD(P)-dependent oxidoreductase [Gemmatimonadaceae bacterium]
MDESAVDLAGARLVVAGGTGTVGRYLVKALLEAGATVIVPSRTQEKIDKLSAGLDANERDRIEALVGDITDETEGARMVEAAGKIDGAIVSIGRWVSAPEVLDAERADLERAVANYAFEHFSVAKTLLPAVEKGGGGYVMITGSLSYEPDGPGTGLVAIAGAAQSMLARVLMKERAERGARINEIVIYSSFGRGDDDANEVKGDDVGRVAAFLLSDEGSAVKDQSIHLRSRQDLRR